MRRSGELSAQERRTLASLTRQAYLASSGVSTEGEHETPTTDRLDDDSRDTAWGEEDAVEPATTDLGAHRSGRHRRGRRRGGSLVVSRASAVGTFALLCGLAALGVWWASGAVYGVVAAPESAPLVASSNHSAPEEASGPPPPLPSIPAVPSAADMGDSSSEAPLSRVTVHVAGAVHDPGVVQIDAPARVVDALELAGGATAEAQLDAVNLASELSDGQQIYIPTLDEASSGGARPHASNQGESVTQSEPGDGLVNLNTADLSRLQDLPGVGPATAEKIDQWRQAHGPFTRAEDLLQISGIGPATLERLRNVVTF